MEEVYEDDSNFPNISRNGMRPESAMVICNDQGDVVGIVGGRGKKTDNRVLVRADSPRQAGSSIKPLSAYGPAMDAGLITPYSVRDNAPFKEIDGRAWAAQRQRRIHRTDDHPQRGGKIDQCDCRARCR